MARQLLCAFLLALAFFNGCLHSTSGVIIPKGTYPAGYNPPLSDFKKDKEIFYKPMKDCNVEEYAGIIFHGRVATAVTSIDSQEVCVSLCYQYRQLGFQCAAVNYVSIYQNCELLVNGKGQGRQGRQQTADNSNHVIVISCRGGFLKNSLSGTHYEYTNVQGQDGRQSGSVSRLANNYGTPIKQGSKTSNNGFSGGQSTTYINTQVEQESSSSESAESFSTQSEITGGFKTRVDTTRGDAQKLTKTWIIQNGKPVLVSQTTSGSASPQAGANTVNTYGTGSQTVATDEDPTDNRWVNKFGVPMAGMTTQTRQQQSGVNKKQQTSNTEPNKNWVKVGSQWVKPDQAQAPAVSQPVKKIDQQSYGKIANGNGNVQFDQTWKSQQHSSFANSFTQMEDQIGQSVPQSGPSVDNVIVLQLQQDLLSATSKLSVLKRELSLLQDQSDQQSSQFVSFQDTVTSINQMCTDADQLVNQVTIKIPNLEQRIIELENWTNERDEKCQCLDVIRFS